MQNQKLFWLSLLHFMSFFVLNNAAQTADIGVILDHDHPVGRIFKTCISMAIEDFYSVHKNYTTMIRPHFRDSRNGVVPAASAAIDLLKNTEVMAILGPLKSAQADFVINIGDQVRVPIISPATSPSLSPKESPYFVRSAWCSSFQTKAIAAIIKAFGWREVVFIHEDTVYGSGLVPFLAEALLEINALVSYQSVVSLSAKSDHILKELYKLKTMQTRVFVVHMRPGLASCFFKLAKEAGMMRKGYTWIIADALTTLLDFLGSETIEAMQGVIGVKAYVPRSKELADFTKRWSKRFHEENPDLDSAQLNVFGLWAYDSITALAEAIERYGVTSSPRFKKPAVKRRNLTELEAIGTSNNVPSFVHSIRNIRFKGLSGDFHMANGQLLPSAFEIVNVIDERERRVGFWTEKYGISKWLKWDNSKAIYSSDKNNLRAIEWPGQTNVVPKGWEIPTSRNKYLKVGVPVKGGFNEFVKVERDAETNAVIATGFCIDVFKEVVSAMPYDVPVEYEPFETPEGKSAGDYNDLVHQIFLEKYDAVVGDVTIVANRSRFVDFTFPYTESGVATVVPIKDTERKNAWIFMRPLTTSLWLTIGSFFIFTGFVVWVLEHRVNKEFRGPPLQQVGIIFWFSFSTLVFAHREKVISNLTRFVMIVWVFVVLVLTSSYTASLTSMLTVQQLQPTITDIYDLIKHGEHVGYQNGSFVSAFLNNLKLDGKRFDSSKLRNYSTLEEYDEALSKGSKNGGVAAIVDELPYVRLFLSKYCHKYTMIGPAYKTSGFGFAFPKGSPLVPDVSRAILNLIEDEKMVEISRKWFGEEGCHGSDGSVITSDSLDLDSFKGIFLIAGLSSSLALAAYLSVFLYENRSILSSTTSIKQKLYRLCRAFDQERDDRLLKESKSGYNGGGRVSAESPAISIPCECDREGMLVEDETEPATPTHSAPSNI